MMLKTHQDEQPSLNLTPMIDVLFQLLIFFMVGTQFTNLERKIDLQVPEVASKDALSAAPRQCVVEVFRDGAIAIDQQPVTRDELVRELTARRQGRAGFGVVIRGDGQGAFQHIAEVLGACREAGVSDMGVTVRLASRPAPAGTIR